MKTVLIFQHIFIFALAMMPTLVGIVSAKYYIQGQHKTSILFYIFGVVLCLGLIFLGTHSVKSNWHIVRVLAVFFPDSPV